MKQEKRHAMLTVFGNDQPGIIASVTEILYQHGCNLEDVSMTVLESELAMMLVVGFKASQGQKIQNALHQKLEKKGKLTCFWRELSHDLRRGEKHLKNSETFLLTCAGKDRTGIVYHVSRLMAKYKLNINDLNCKILGYGPKAIYTMLLEVDIPRLFPLQKLQNQLDKLSQKLHITLHLKPLERIEL
ncbi:MAG: hypothetical protein HYZ83_06410 [Candidatus Omnitrophica bacterium]|nr:hypothetical protein [Candidatus Omnitrophota bacterium]